jgi:hypothetical protein
MAQRRGRTQPCDSAQARRRLGHAVSFLEVAELAADVNNLSLEYASVVATPLASETPLLPLPRPVWERDLREEPADAAWGMRAAAACLFTVEYPRSRRSAGLLDADLPRW